jgi:hypothetical protein
MQALDIPIISAPAGTRQNTPSTPLLDWRAESKSTFLGPRQGGTFNHSERKIVHKSANNSQKISGTDQAVMCYLETVSYEGNTV